MANRTASLKPKSGRKAGVTFALTAPSANAVLVTGTFCDWETQSHAMKRGHQGTWTATIPLAPGRHEYRFLVDGAWRDDPNCLDRVANPFGSENCVVHVLRQEIQAVRAAPECAEPV